MKIRTKLLLMVGIALALLVGTVEKAQAELFDMANVNKAIINKTLDQKDSIPTNPNQEKAAVETNDDDWDTEEEDLDAYLAESQERVAKLEKENAKLDKENAKLEETIAQQEAIKAKNEQIIAKLKGEKGDKKSQKK